MDDCYHIRVLKKKNYFINFLFMSGAKKFYSQNRIIGVNVALCVPRVRENLFAICVNTIFFLRITKFELQNCCINSIGVMKFFVIRGLATVVWLNFFQYGHGQIPLPMPEAIFAPPMLAASISPYRQDSVPSREKLYPESVDSFISEDFGPGVSRSSASIFSSESFEEDSNRSEDADSDKATTTTDGRTETATTEVP